MANEEHRAILRQGIDTWNNWRRENKNIVPDLRETRLYRANLSGANLCEARLDGAYLFEADLTGANLSGAVLVDAILIEAKLTGADLSGTNLYRADLAAAKLHDAKLINARLKLADLTNADLTEAKLYEANLEEAKLYETKLIKANLTKATLYDSKLRKADFTKANLTEANLIKADFTNANLTGADLTRANLSGADLTGADLSKAKLVNTLLEQANLVKTKFAGATLDNCRIYGISVWDVQLNTKIQKNLIISPDEETEITVDDLEVAQFIYLLLNNSKLRNVIDTITGKAALILGRFTEERKVVLDAIRDALRAQGYLPILFDFEKPASRDLTETILTLASLSRFIIADLTDAKSIPLELKTIVPNLLSVAVQPIILKSQREFSMFEHIARFQSVLPIHEYESQDSLMSELSEKVIQPAEQKANEMRPKPLK